MQGDLSTKQGQLISGHFKKFTQQPLGRVTIDSKLTGFCVDRFVWGTLTQPDFVIDGCFVYPTTEWIGRAKIQPTDGSPTKFLQRQGSETVDCSEQDFIQEFNQHFDLLQSLTAEDYELVAKLKTHQELAT